MGEKFFGGLLSKKKHAKERGKEDAGAPKSKGSIATRFRLWSTQSTAKTEHSLESSTASAPEAASVAPQSATRTTDHSSAAPTDQLALPKTPTSPSRLGEPETPARSLWGRAYCVLKDKDGRLVEQYEKLLSRELLRTDALSNDFHNLEESLDKTENRIDHADPENRRAQLETIIDRGLQRMDERRIKYTIAGHDFVVQDQITEAVALAQGMKVFIGEAVKASPEASLALAGVCIILPIFTNPAAAELANSDGFTYVSSRMRFYVELEHLLWPKNMEPATKLKKEFEDHIVDLYQHVLEFQLKSVLRFYRKWVARVVRDMSQHEDWGGILSKVKELENIVKNDSESVNTLASRRELEILNDKAGISLDQMQMLLSAAEQQLQALKDIARNTKPPINLEVVQNAIYDSAEDQDIPQCQPGTRRSVLEQITTWMAGPEVETIFWLSGPAGTGKSTISRTVAHSLDETRQLGASYFFKRGAERRNSTSLFFPTIAAQLARTTPAFGTRLRESLKGENDFKVENKALEEQFRTLIQTPLSKMRSDEWGVLTKVILIDGLDECERIVHISRILNLFSQLRATTPVRLRVFLTSRSAYPIVSAFKDLDKKGILYHKLALDKEFPNETRDDISAFLKQRFVDITIHREITEEPWPTPEQLDYLIDRATTPSPLFIYAATLCRFVDDTEGREEPTQRLAVWLKQCNSNAPQLNQIYMPILHYLFFGSYNMLEKPNPLSDEDRSQLLLVLGAIVLFNDPLPARGIAALLDITPTRINFFLGNLHAVLSVPGDPGASVQLLHKSFSDFLLGQEGTGTTDFRVDAVETHKMLALKCIHRMNNELNGLRKDICDIREPGKMMDGIDETIVARQIPPDLKYACRYWVYHLQESKELIQDGDEVVTFFHEHFLHWLEAMSLINKTSESIRLIDKLLDIVDTDNGVEVSVFLRDAKRFALYFRSVIGMAPLQVYFSALMFAPERSVIRQRFSRDMSSWISNMPIVELDWSPCLQTLIGHSGSVYSAAFTADGNQLASGSGDKTIKIWDTATGECVRTLTGHSSSVYSVAFTTDGSQLASGSDDKTIKIWDTATGECIRTLTGHNSSVLSVAFTTDSSQLASGSHDSTIKIWDIATSECVRTLTSHSGSVYLVAFTTSGSQLASGSSDETIKIWDTATGECVRTLISHSGSILSVVFTTDGSQLASGSDDETIKIWDTATGECVRTLTGHSGLIYSVAFTTDGSQLASGSSDETIKIWDTATGKCVHTLYVGTILSHLSFDSTGSFLLTNIGRIEVHPLPQPQAMTQEVATATATTTVATTAKSPAIEIMDIKKYGYGLSSDESWITHDGQNMLWLPPECRSDCSAVHEQVVSIGCRSGRVLIFCFSPSG